MGHPRFVVNELPLQGMSFFQPARVSYDLEARRAVGHD
jgi:hypothetical protein